MYLTYFDMDSDCCRESMAETSLERSFGKNHNCNYR